MGVLYTPDTDLTLRVVAMDLLYTQAQHISQEQLPAQVEQVVYNIKEVSDRLGLRPHVIRRAYEQLEERGALHIDARSFPTRRRQQLPLPLDRET
jgi:DNA-binding transcriptional regulator YhcF (GntR family)